MDKKKIMAQSHNVTSNGIHYNYSNNIDKSHNAEQISLI